MNVTTTPKIALVTSGYKSRLEDESGALADALNARGAQADVRQWDDPDVPWGEYDLAVLTTMWDHNERREEFLGWCSSVPRLVNPPNVVRWNSDKHYIEPLSQHGLPIIETTWLEPERNFEKRDLHNRFPAREEFVIKPAISAGSRGSGRYTATDADSRRYAINHAHRLLEQGRSVMVQRYIPEIDLHGEVALIFFHGTFSHAVRKDPMLSSDTDEVVSSYQPEKISPYQATNEEIKAAQNVLSFARARIPGRSINSRPLLYARVDLVTPTDGPPLLMELELIESFIYSKYDSGAVDRFADAIMAEARMGPDSQNIDLA